MNPLLHIWSDRVRSDRIALTGIGRDRPKGSLAHVQGAKPERGPNPLVQIERRPVDAEIIDAEIQKTERLSRIADEVDPLAFSVRSDRRDGQDQAVLITRMRDQGKLQVGVLHEGVCVQTLDRGSVRARRQLQRDHAYASALLEPRHGALEGGVVDVGKEHGIPGPEPAILANEVVDRFRGVPRQRNFLDIGAEQARDPLAGVLVVGAIEAPRVERVVLVHARERRLVPLQHRIRHAPPVAVLEVHDAFRAREIAADAGPVRFVRRERAGLDVDRRRHVRLQQVERPCGPSGGAEQRRARESLNNPAPVRTAATAPW